MKHRFTGSLVPVLALLLLASPVAVAQDTPSPEAPATEARGTEAPAAEAPAPERPARIYWLPSEPVRGDALVVDVQPYADTRAVEGVFAGRDLAFFPWGEGRWRAVAPIPLNLRARRPRLEVILVGADGERRADRRRVFVRRGDFPESKLSVDPKFTKPPAEALARIRADRKKIKVAFAESAPRRLWRAPFVRPVDGVVTSPYGGRRTFNGKVRSRHRGLDLDGRTGDPIRAMAAGRVTLADDLFYTGGCVFLDHGLGMYTVYFHMSEVDVAEGQQVEAGEVIGKVGATGRVTGPHLHFGVKLNGTYVSPSRLLELELGQDPGRTETASTTGAKVTDP